MARKFTKYPNSYVKASLEKSDFKKYSQGADSNVYVYEGDGKKWQIFQGYALINPDGDIVSVYSDFDSAVRRIEKYGGEK